MDKAERRRLLNAAGAEMMWGGRHKVYRIQSPLSYPQLISMSR